PIGSDDRVWVLVDRLEAGNLAPQRLTESVEAAFARGDGRAALLLGDREVVFDSRWVCPRCASAVPEPEPRLFDCNDPRGACPTCDGTGLVGKTFTACPECAGRRWNRAALSVRLAGKNIAELSAMALDDLATFVALFSQ